MNPLFVRLGLHSREFTEGMVAARKQLTEMNESTKRLSAGFDSMKKIAVTVFGGIGIQEAFSKIIGAAEEQEKAYKKLDNVLKATGQTVGYTTKQLADYASELQNLTTYGDEVIIDAQAMLASFKNIQGIQFKEAVKEVLNLSTVMDGDLKASVLQVGKALNDPIANLGALSRVGIQFTKTQKEQIKDFAESNQLAKAQAIILEELRSKFGGAAEAMKNTFGGSIMSAKNAFDDFLEILGDVIIKNEDLIRVIKELEKKFKDPEFISYFVSGMEGIVNIAITTAEAFGKLLSMIEKIRDAWRELEKFHSVWNEMPSDEEPRSEFAKRVYESRIKAQDQTGQFFKIDMGQQNAASYKDFQKKVIEEDYALTNDIINKKQDAYIRHYRLLEDLLNDYSNAEQAIHSREINQIQDLYDLLDKYDEAVKSNVDKDLEHYFGYIDTIEKKYKENSNYMKQLSIHTAEAMQDAFADFFFDAFTGKLETLGDYITSFLNSVLKAFSQVIAQRIVYESLFSLGLTGKASGGSVFAGQSYLVGEKGPEVLHMGASNGYITPNSNIGGNTRVIVNNYSNTPATVSEKQGSDGVRELLIVIANDVENGGIIGRSIQRRLGALPQMRQP